MDEPTFDGLTRLLGKAQSRREALRILVTVGGAAFIAACTGQVSSPSPSASPSPSPSPSLAAGDECANPSTCGARNYCNEEHTCICIKSAEGPVRCGQLPSSCNQPLCTTSADCVAAFGVATAFCDTPNSGCCTDPPAELPRCLLPCGVGPAITPTASPYVTPAISWNTTAVDHRGMIGQRFDYICPPGGTPSGIYGTYQYTDDSSICTAAVHVGLITLANGGSVQIEMRGGLDSYPGSTRNGITSSPWSSFESSFVFPAAPPVPTASPATVTCPTNGTCQECRLSADNQTVNCTDCATAGVAATLCGSANADVGFTALAGRLLADGYRQVPPTGVESVELYGGDGFERSLFVSQFALASDASQVAQLVYRKTFADEATAFALLLRGETPERTLFAQPDGTLEEHEIELATPPPVALAGGLNAALAGELTGALFGCKTNCTLLCSALLGLGLAVLGGALCFTGACLLAVFIYGTIGRTVLCSASCDKYCAEAPPRAYCGCNNGRGCYDTASACTARCRSGLGCFAQNLCGPSPICTPLKEFGS